MAGDSSMGGKKRTWPDDLKLGDRFQFQGDTYEVVGTGPGEATADRVGDQDVTAEIGRWAFTDAVYIELEISMSQQEFGDKVNQRGAEDSVRSDTENERSGADE